MLQPNIGHNKPPSESEILQERLNEYKDTDNTIKRLSEFQVPEEIQDEQQAGRIADHIKALNGVKKDVSDIHKKEKQPFLDAGRVADGWKKVREEMINGLVSRASVPLNAFLTKKAEEERQRQLEQARKAREEADRLAAEAAAHEAEGIEDTAEDLMNAAVESDTKADMIYSSAIDTRGRARTMMSSASQKKVWVGEIEAVAAVDLEVLRKYFKEEDIQKAINAAIRDGVRDIRGVNIYQKTSITVR